MKKIWQFVIIIPIIIGIGIGTYISIFKQIQTSNNNNNKISSVFGEVSSKTAKVSKFYSYGTSLNIEGNIEGISKDNFEGIRIIVTDGGDYSKYYNAEYSFSDEGLFTFKTGNINNSIKLDELSNRDVLCFSKT